ncbi:hypothetical protein [Thioclava indica]|uniref:Uncharacterized protein n=1 Tax=Thioclava indica TaxID=1353528 RepID=A0A074K1D4_9RHOB|nr:hypothetical protein [Thioclava indica]KEO61563.1 hypothetical protein DT23_00930 [Thioclava indica]
MSAQKALRIVLTQEGSSFRLESATRIDKVLQPSDPLETSDGEFGAWVALEDGSGRHLFRRVLDNPLDLREVFTGERQEMRRVRIEEPQAVISFLMPLLDDAKTLTVHASDTGGKTATPAKPVFKVELRNLLARSKEGRPGHGRQ